MNIAHVRAALDLIDPAQAGIPEHARMRVAEAADLLATQLREVDRLTRELADSRAACDKALGQAVFEANMELAERTRERDDVIELYCDDMCPTREFIKARGWPLDPEEPQP